MTLPGRIGRYHIERLLGQGAMGSVYKAFDPIIRRTVAIKTIRTNHFTKDSDRDQFLKRFNHEAEVCGKLKHNHIIVLFDLGIDAGDPFIAMEYLEGKTLEERIKNRPNFDVQETTVILNQVANALDFAHEHGIVHRDIKPQNIMVTNDLVAKIMDFGIAKTNDSNMTKTGFFVGTPSYSSPEQISGDPVGSASDQFSFGVLAFELLTGHNPFAAKNISSILYQVVNGDPNFDFIPDFMEPVKSHLIATFGRVLDKNPEMRFGTVSEFMKNLNPVLREIQQLSQVAETSEHQIPSGTGQNTAAQTKPLPDWERSTQQKARPQSTQTPTARFAQSPTAMTEHIEHKKQKPWLGISLAGAVVVALVITVFALVKKDPAKPKQEDEKPQIPDLVIAPKTTSLRIDSTPQGATIRLNGEDVGLSPFSWELPEDREESLTIEIHLEGFESQRVNIQPGDLLDPEMHLTLIELPEPEPEKVEVDPVILARQKEEKLWQDTLAKSSIAEFQNYISKYPQGEYVEPAQKAILGLRERQSYEKAMASPSPGELNQFLKSYPDSRYAFEIQGRLDQLQIKNALDTALEDGTEKALTAFLEQFGSKCSDSQRDVVRKKLSVWADKKQELAAFEKANQSMNLVTLKDYLLKYGGVEPSRTSQIIEQVDREKGKQQLAIQKQFDHKAKRKYKAIDKNEGLEIQISFNQPLPIALVSATIEWKLENGQTQRHQLDNQNNQWKTQVPNDFLEQGDFTYTFSFKDVTGEAYHLQNDTFKTKIVKPDAKDKVVITY